MNKYNVLIIGAGNKGALSDAPGSGNEHKYLSYAHAVKDHSGYDLIGFYDISEQQRINGILKWGIKCTWGIPHVVVIATPDDSHYDYLVEYADHKRAKPRLVICEKPLCMTSQEAQEVIQLYQQKSIPLMVDYTRRFIPKYREVQQKIAAGLYGQFIEGYCYFNRGWEHTASHFIDLALWFNGSLDNINIREIKTDYQWAFQLGLFYERDFFAEHAPHYGDKIEPAFDKHLWYVMDNAYKFLEGKEHLYCTGEDGLNALTETERLMRGGY